MKISIIVPCFKVIAARTPRAPRTSPLLVAPVASTLRTLALLLLKLLGESPQHVTKTKTQTKNDYDMEQPTHILLCEDDENLGMLL